MNVKNFQEPLSPLRKFPIGSYNCSYWNNFRKLRNAITTQLRKERSNYYSSLLAGKQDSKEMWKMLNQIFPKSKKNIKSTVTNCLGLTAEKFNIFYTTIVEKLRNTFHVSTVLPKLQTPMILSIKKSHWILCVNN